MEFEEFERQEDDDEDDAAIQYMIEQSLLESIKQMETLRDPTAEDTRRSDRSSLRCAMVSSVLLSSFSHFCFTTKKKI